MHDDVGTVLHRPAQVGRSEGAVDDEREVVGGGHVAEGGQVGDGARRVADDLGVEEAGAIVDRRGEGRRVVTVDEAGVDAEPAERDVEHRVRAAVEGRRGDEVVAGGR